MSLSRSEGRKASHQISWPLERDAGSVNHTIHFPYQRQSDDIAPSSRNGHQYHPSHSSNSTAPPSIRPSNDSFHESQCSLSLEEYFARSNQEMNITDDFPTKDALKTAGDVPLYDASGQSQPFKSFYNGENTIGQRQMFIFVRHFYCSACQAYVKALRKSITPDTYFSMPIPTSIIVIGCGSPLLIRQYQQRTDCPFPIFADPTRMLYKILGMSWSVKLGVRPEYMVDVSILNAFTGAVEEYLHTERRHWVKGGQLLQIGGEFMWEDGELVWCHRMKNVRGHAELEILRRVLDID